MKKRGKIDNGELAKLGLSLEIKEDPESESKQDIEAVKERQAKEMKALLEAERRAENERAQRLNAAQEEEERQRIQIENEQAKALSSDRIAKLQLSHQ